MTAPKARSARSPLRGRGKAQRVAVDTPERSALIATLRHAATGGAAAELDDALGSAVWLAPADAAAVGILGDVLRALEPPPLPVGILPATDAERAAPRVVNADALKALVPIALDLIRALGLTPQARAALNIELIPGPTPSLDGRHTGYSEPEPLRK
jgi:hypothetical protein